MSDQSVDVCFSPALLNAVIRRDRMNVVVVDILRATTAMCTAFGYGVNSIIPMSSEKKALEMKNEGWLVAGEKDGVRLGFADFGNSPLEFRNETVKDKNIIYSTTNGTKAIKLASGFGDVYIASFVNLEAICQWLYKEQKDVLILCAGWKDQFSLEDAICAGAISDLLVNAYGYIPGCDATIASMELWNQSVKNIIKIVSRSTHYLRLLGIENRKGLKYCFYPEIFHVIPMLGENGITDIAL